MQVKAPPKRPRKGKIIIHEEITTDHINDDKSRLLALPVEILIKILSYLDCQDLETLRKVSKCFETLVLFVWREYEVKEPGPMTSEVIHQLKRMPLLTKISIDSRTDCDEILRQLSLTNKKIEKLKIINCTGSCGNIYLRSSHLTRILERCSNLHTINIEGSRLRGQKFYRLLGDKGIKLRSLNCTATGTQFCVFSKYLQHLESNDRLAMHNIGVGCRTWSSLRYFVAVHTDRTVVKPRYTAMVTYVDKSLSFNIKNII